MKKNKLMKNVVKQNVNQLKNTKKDNSSLNKRKPRILWANHFCMLDTSSGASISIRQILHQLHKSGFEVEIVGATIFDNEKGISRLQSSWDEIQSNPSEIININDFDLCHQLIKTESLTRDKMSVKETDNFFKLYTSRLDQFKPDLVFFYGGQSSDYHIPGEARARGIPSIAYLVNGNYLATRWCRDVDLILTDSHATSNYYYKQIGFKPNAIGKFIEQSEIIAPKHDRKNLTLINPSWEKGAGIVAMLAAILEKTRPDITFEVVESRGNWSEIVSSVTSQVFGETKTHLSNVIITPNTNNISEVYERSRLIIGLSQWWESGSRVLAEAMLNGIPAIVSNYGGNSEMIGEGGIVIDLPIGCHKVPFNTLPNLDKIQSLASIIKQIWDDEAFYLSLVSKALKQGFEFHQISKSTSRLIHAISPLLNKKVGDKNIAEIMKKFHKHGLCQSQNHLINDLKLLETA